ncbi:MAG: thioredoxin family protein [Dehalococcoidia bacterium]
MDTIELEVYVDEGCATCQRAAALARQVEAEHPEVTVTLVYARGDQGAHRHLVAAVPTYILNGRVVSLGNPRLADLEAAIRLAGGPA